MKVDLREWNRKYQDIFLQPSMSSKERHLWIYYAYEGVEYKLLLFKCKFFIHKSNSWWLSALMISWVYITNSYFTFKTFIDRSTWLRYLDCIIESQITTDFLITTFLILRKSFFLTRKSSPLLQFFKFYITTLMCVNFSSVFFCSFNILSFSLRGRVE